jgi:hypothetical protein
LDFFLVWGFSAADALKDFLGGISEIESETLLPTQGFSLARIFQFDI